MILQRLYDDAPKILGEILPPPMYDVKPVRWVIQLRADGTLAEFIPLGGEKESKRGVPKLVPYLGRTSSIRPILLADSPAYVLGHASEDKRAAEKHLTFNELVHQCAEETGEQSVKAVDTFLNSWDPSTGAPPVDMTPADLLTFQVDGVWPTELVSVQIFWARTARPPGDAESQSQCLVSGQIGPTEKSLPGVIKRVPNGQASGIALVSANESAYESYGLQRAQTSPICAEAAERFTKSLNKLIEGHRTHITLAGLVFVFWTSEGEDEVWYDLIDRAEPGQVRDLLRSYHEGKPYTAIDEAKFNAFALSASGARAVIRDTLSTTVRSARDRLARWFEDQEIVSADGSETRHFSPYHLINSLFRDRKDASPQTAQAFLRAAVHGEPLPRVLLERAVLRCRAEQKVTPARAAVIKAVLIRQHGIHIREENAIMAELNPNNPDRAYQCGRLLAVLESTQRAALGKINATLVDRYYGAASTTPATVFGILLSNATKAHLPKIRKQNMGTYNALRGRIGEISEAIGSAGFPRTLTLEQQALFALGYYQQIAAGRAAAQEARARKARGEASQHDDALLEITDDTEAVYQED